MSRFECIEGGDNKKTASCLAFVVRAVGTCSPSFATTNFTNYQTEAMDWLFRSRDSGGPKQHYITMELDMQASYFFKKRYNITANSISKIKDNVM